MFPEKFKLSIDTAPCLNIPVINNLHRLPNFTWNQELSHGRINVRRAIDLANKFSCKKDCK